MELGSSDGGCGLGSGGLMLLTQVICSAHGVPFLESREEGLIS